MDVGLFLSIYNPKIPLNSAHRQEQQQSSEVEVVVVFSFCGSFTAGVGVSTFVTTVTGLSTEAIFPTTTARFFETTVLFPEIIS